jgi:hypothetical protein
MRRSKTPASEQYRLVMEARQSGLSDAEWCRQHGIGPSTFYNWTVRLRKQGCELPQPWRDEKLPSLKQDVVLLDVIPDEPDVHPVCIEAPSNSQPLILEMNGAKLTIPNGIDTLLLSQVISAMKGSLC